MAHRRYPFREGEIGMGQHCANLLGYPSILRDADVCSPPCGENTDPGGLEASVAEDVALYRDEQTVVGRSTHRDPMRGATQWERE
jgi:hypothetical protein